MGAVVCGDCTTPNITYLWEQSTDGITWIPAVFNTVEVPVALRNNTSQNFQTPRLVENRYYRRLATCNCRPARTIISPMARVLMPGLPASAFPAWVEIDGIRWVTRNVCFTTTCTATFPNLPNELRGFTYHPTDPGMMFQFGKNVGWSHFGNADTRHYWTGTGWSKIVVQKFIFGIFGVCG